MKLYHTGKKKIYLPRGMTCKIYMGTRKSLSGSGLILSYKFGSGIKMIQNETKENPPDTSSLNDKLAKLHIGNRGANKKKKFVNFSI
jgi:hypothetical protein